MIDPDQNKTWHMLDSINSTYIVNTAGYSVISVASTAAISIISAIVLKRFPKFDISGCVKSSKTMEESIGTTHERKILVGICTIAPVLEEVIFRGVLQPGIKKLCLFSGCDEQRASSIAVSGQTIIFGMMCLQPSLGWRKNLTLTAYTGLQGYVWGLVAEKSNSLLPSILGHSFHNYLAFRSTRSRVLKQKTVSTPS